MQTALTDITRAMSVAIAPVFLVTGVSGLLAAMSTRYGRVIDHTRVVLREAAAHAQDEARSKRFDTEIRRLYRRARLLRTTIILAATSIFFVTVTIFVIFSTIMLDATLPYTVAILFTLSLIFLIAALALFIEDFAISLGGLKYEIQTRVKRDVIGDGTKAADG